MFIFQIIKLFLNHKHILIVFLGDSKELVRERCQLLLSELMEVGAITPQQLFDRLLPAFSHKNSNVRDEIMKCLIATLNQYVFLLLFILTV